MRRVLLGCVTLLILAAPLAGQQEAAAPSSPALVKYGKWVTLAAAAAMNLMAAREHDRADRAFAFITRACVQDTANCATQPGGAYADPFLEQKYQESLDHDRSARRYLIGGETVLVGTAVMFIWELTRSKSRPGNIPFEPEVGQRDGKTEIGLRFEF
jgi:hypothetical protein